MPIDSRGLALTFAMIGPLYGGATPAVAQPIPTAKAGITPAALVPVRLSAREQANRSIVAVQTVSLALSQGVIDERQRTQFETLEGEKKAALAAVDAATAQGARALQSAQTRLDQARLAFEAEVDRLVAANQGLQREVEAMGQTLLVSLPTLSDEEVRLRQRFADGDRVGTRAIMEKLDADWDASAQLSLERAQAELARTTNLQRAARKREGAQRAAVSVSKGDPGVTSSQVLDLWDQAAVLDGTDFWTHIERTRLAQTLGNLTRSRVGADDAVRAARQDWQRGAAQEALGEIAMLQGDLFGAGRAFQDYLSVYRRLAGANPNQAWIQRNLSTSLNKVGGVAVLRGDIAGASRAYNEALAIVRRLVERDASSPVAQRAVSTTLIKVGDIGVSQGDLTGASQAYNEALALDRRLLAMDPNSVATLQDLAISLNKVGAVAIARGDLESASRVHAESLAISRGLSDKDPSSAAGKRNVAVSLDNVGYVARLRGDLAGASRAYNESLTLGRGLVALDPSSASAQRDLSVSLDNVGDIAVSRRDYESAARLFSESLVIMRRLLALDPSSAQTQRDVSVTLNKLGNVARLRSDLDGAGRAFIESLAIARRLVALDPSSAVAQSTLAFSLTKVGDVAKLRGDLNAAGRAYQESLVLRRSLSLRDPSSVDARRDLGLTLYKLALMDGSNVGWAEVAAHWRLTKRNGHLVPMDEPMFAQIEQLATQEATNARPPPRN